MEHFVLPHHPGQSFKGSKNLRKGDAKIHKTGNLGNSKRFQAIKHIMAFLSGTQKAALCEVSFKGLL